MRTHFKTAHAWAIFLLVSVIEAQTALAQQAPPVLKANSAVVDVRDGDKLLRADWIIDPKVALDVYVVRRTTEGKRVTFITDIDSMSFDVQPGHTYDFDILLNGKDACHTRISTMTQSYRRVYPSPKTGQDTIPISIRHGKLHLEGKINDSRMLDFIFDTGAEICALYPSAISKAVTLRFDGTINNSGTGGTTLRQTSSDNRLEIAGLRWDHEPVMYVEKQADGAADGIVGYPVFEGKVVEIDFDRMIMIVHDTLPAHAAGFAKTPMPFSGSLPAVESVLVNGEKRATGLFVLDTGGTGAMLVNQAFAATRGLHGTMKNLGARTSRGVGSEGIRSHLLLLPQLALAGFALSNVPINVELPSEGNEAPPGGVLCMEVLRRFNTILDFQRNEAYFKPNTSFSAPFKARFSGPSLSMILGIAVASVVLFAGLVLLRARRRRSPEAMRPAS
jgi:predicted RNA-binding protein